MTEVEFSRLLSDLAKTAENLNRESDSINELIERFQETLRKLNIGLEVWLTSDPISSAECKVEAYDEMVPGSLDVHLGFIKSPPLDEWMLVTRRTWYRRSGEDWQLLSTERAIPLLAASRKDRIDALEKFPALLNLLKDEAESALKAIERAKKFVK